MVDSWQVSTDTFWVKWVLASIKGLAVQSRTSSLSDWFLLAQKLPFLALPWGARYQVSGTPFGVENNGGLGAAEVGSFARSLCFPLPSGKEFCWIKAAPGPLLLSFCLGARNRTQFPRKPEDQKQIDTW